MIFSPDFADASIKLSLFSLQNISASLTVTCLKLIDHLIIFYLLLSISSLFPTTIIKTSSGTLSDISFNHFGIDKKEFLSNYINFINTKKIKTNKIVLNV